MAEQSRLSTLMKTFNTSRKPVTHLMDAIKAGDIEKCVRLVKNMNKRQLNKLKRRNYSGYINCNVTPLMWAVMHGQYCIAEILLSKGSLADKFGFCSTRGILLPLFVAIDENDDKMVDLLIKYGANVHLSISKLIKIKGLSGLYQKNGCTYPIQYCYGKKISIFEKLLQHADMSMEYFKADMSMEYFKEQHTCFYGVIEYYIKMGAVIEDLKYVLLVLQYGGRVCHGGICMGGISFSGNRGLVCVLISQIYDAIHDKNRDLYLPSIVGSINCLYYVCCSDYMYEFSPIYVFPKLLASHINDEDISSLRSIDSNNEYQNQIYHKLAWILNLADNPSSLQEISRAVIRSNLRPCTPHTCSMLPLPSKLVNYVSFTTDQFCTPRA